MVPTSPGGPGKPSRRAGTGPSQSSGCGTRPQGLSRAPTRSTPHGGRTKITGFHPTNREDPGKNPQPARRLGPHRPCPKPVFTPECHLGPTGSSGWDFRAVVLSPRHSAGMKTEAHSPGPARDSRDPARNASRSPRSPDKVLSLWGGGRSLLTERGKSRLGAGGGRNRSPYSPVSLIQHSPSS